MQCWLIITLFMSTNILVKIWATFISMGLMGYVSSLSKDTSSWFLTPKGTSEMPSKCLEKFIPIQELIIEYLYIVWWTYPSNWIIPQCHIWHINWICIYPLTICLFIMEFEEDWSKVKIIHHGFKQHGNSLFKCIFLSFSFFWTSTGFLHNSISCQIPSTSFEPAQSLENGRAVSMWWVS